MQRHKHSLAVAASIFTFLLLLVGGLVNPTQSSLACPDWPLCFGEVFPDMVGGVLYEHSHRLLAFTVGVITCVLAILLALGRREDRALPWLGGAAVFIVILQGVLGGLTVIFKLPSIISIAHLGLSMIFFLFLIYIAVRTYRRRTEVRADVSPSTRLAIVAATAAVWVQIVLGGVVRHTGSGLACLNELPFCGGSLWPTHMHAMARIHMLHRIVGVLAGVLVIYAAVRLLRHAATAAARRLAIASIVLVLVQIALGVITVLSMRGLVEVELHLAGGALLLADLWLLTLLTRAVPVRVPALAQESL
jgi:heme A synthase